MCSHLAHFISRVIDSCQIGFNYFGYRVVIKTDKSNIIGYPDSCLFKSHHTSHGAIIIRYKNSIRPGIHFQKYLSGTRHPLPDSGY